VNKSGFSVPAEDRHFEDYILDSVHEFGAIEVEEAELLAFSRRFDPQLFHADPQAAKESEFGGLIASGWYTVSLMMRLFVDNFLPRKAGLASPEVTDLRWIKPVRPGDWLSIRVTIKAAARSRSKPDRGVVHTFTEILNQDREVVGSLKQVNIFLCRDPL
jgi:acyl dehydratase